jgi:hypothetical protein
VLFWKVDSLRELLASVLRVASLRRWLARAMRVSGVFGITGRLPSIISVELVPLGVRFWVEVARGTHAGQLHHQAEHLAAALKVREVRIGRLRSDASVAEVLVVRRDPFQSAGSSPWPWAGMAATSLWQSVPLGFDEEGRTVQVSLPEHNLLLGGEPGAGKSAVLSLFVAAAALDPDVRLTLLDAKQVELAPWAGSADAFVGPSIPEAIEVLRELCAEMDRRYGALLAAKRRKVAPGDELPLYVVAIDELAWFLRAEKRDERTELQERLRDLVSRGRAAGMIVIAATQKPSNEVVPTFIRDLFSFRMALRCTTPESSDTILGQGWASQGYSGQAIDPSSRGIGFLLAEGGVPVKCRAHYLDDEAVADLARRAELLRKGRLGDES